MTDTEPVFITNPTGYQPGKNILKTKLKERRRMQH
jgi:hypothetical protein